MENLLVVPADATREQIEQAVAKGNEIRDGMMVLERKGWKTENGNNWYDSGNKGEILGEEASPRHEIDKIGDDMIQLDMMRYIRAE